MDLGDDYYASFNRLQEQPRSQRTQPTLHVTLPMWQFLLNSYERLNSYASDKPK